MRYIAAAIIAVAVLAGPARAQDEEGQKNPLQLQYEAERKAQEDVAKRYDETLKKTRAAGPAVNKDPWSTVRAPASTDAKKK